MKIKGFEINVKKLNRSEGVLWNMEILNIELRVINM